MRAGEIVRRVAHRRIGEEDDDRAQNDLIGDAAHLRIVDQRDFGGPPSCAMLIRSPETPTLSVPLFPTHFILPYRDMQALCQKRAGWYATRPSSDPVSAIAAGRAQRIGGAYCRPPLVHSAFRPRAILSGEPWPDVPLEDLAVVADMLDDAIGPVLGQAELLAVIAFGAEQALDVRIGRTSSPRRRSPW